MQPVSSSLSSYRPDQTQAGFSLIEAAVGLLVAALVATGILALTSSQYKERLYRESQQTLTQTRQALLSFIRVNKHLPCPDLNGDGVEDRKADHSCQSVNGTVPFLTLNLERDKILDRWNTPIGYYINRSASAYAKISDPAYSASFFMDLNAPVYTNETPPTATANDPDAANLILTDGNGTVLADRLPAILVAFNQNGQLACNQRSGDEQENCDGDQNFIFHPMTTSPFFDDQVATLSRYDIMEALNAPPPPSIPPTGGGTFRSQFAPEHRHLYEEITRLVETRPQLYDTLQPWLQRLIDEDDRLFQAESRGLEASQCQSLPSDISFQISGNLDHPLNLGVGGTPNSVRINGHTLPGGNLFGNSQSNTVAVDGNHLSQMQLNSGNNQVIVTADSAGIIRTSNGHDRIRICGALKALSYELPPTTSYTRFDFNTHRQITPTRWRFVNVADNTDAVVELIDHAPNYPVSQLVNIDYQGSGLSNALQVAMRIPEGLSAGDYWFDFRITFIDPGTPDNVIANGTYMSHARTIPAFTATAVDIDGWLPPGENPANYSRQFEYVELANPVNYQLETPTRLNLHEVNGRVRAEPIEDWVSPELTIEVTENMMTAEYRNVSSFVYRTGVKVEETVHPNWTRLHSLYFDEVQYDNVQTINVAGYVETDGGNDEVLVHDEAELNLDLGNGDNLAYLFDRADDRVDGGTQSDLFATLGELGANSDQTRWQLGEGDNSARIKQTCRAPVNMGSGSDLIILSQGNADQCSFDTRGGHDAVLIYSGTAQQAIQTGEGNDLVVISGTLNDMLQTGEGDDIVDVTGTLGDTVQLGPGKDYALLNTLPAGITIDGGEGFDIVQLTDPALTAADQTTLQTQLPRVERIIFADGTSFYPCAQNLYSLCP